MKLTQNLIKEYIDKFLPLFGEMIKPIDHIIINKTLKNDNGTVSPAMLIGPIDNEYGLCLNNLVYKLDEENIVLPIILHELIHYSLLLEGNQNKGDIHDNIFKEKAVEIETLTNFKGVNIDDNYVQRNLRYKNKTFNVIEVFIKEDRFITTVNNKLFEYFKKYLGKESKKLGIDKYSFFKTNKSIFEQVDETLNIDALNLIKDNENIFII